MEELNFYEPARGFSNLIDSEISERASEQQEKVEVDVKFEQSELVSRTVEGDSNAFDHIFDRYSGLMRRTAYSIVKDRDIAEDVVQNSFIQAWQNLPSLREMGAFRSWLMRILVNQSISFKRRHARAAVILHQSFTEEETERVSQMADYAKGTIERNWDLIQAIKHLPVKQQMVIYLHYYQGMTLPEMSQTLHISENTLKKRVQAALNTLRQMLSKAEIDEESGLY